VVLRVFLGLGNDLCKALPICKRNNFFGNALLIIKLLADSKEWFLFASAMKWNFFYGYYFNSSQ
jgi:hypothetical protein